MSIRQLLAYVLALEIVAFAFWLSSFLWHLQKGFKIFPQIVLGAQPWISIPKKGFRIEVPPVTSSPARQIERKSSDVIWSGIPSWKKQCDNLISIGPYFTNRLLIIEPPLTSIEQDPLTLQTHNSFYPTTDNDIETPTIVVENGWAYISSLSVVPWSKVTGDPITVFVSPPSQETPEVLTLSRSFLPVSTKVEDEFISLLLNQ